MSEKKRVPIKLFMDHVLTTCEITTITEQGILLPGNGEIKTRQTVIAAGPQAFVVPGDEVEISIDRISYIEGKEPKHGIGPDKHKVITPITKIPGDDNSYLLLQQRDIRWMYSKTVDIQKAITEKLINSTLD